MQYLNQFMPQVAGGSAQTAAQKAGAGDKNAGAAAGAQGWLGSFMGSAVEEDKFVTSLKHLESFKGKNVIISGATGGIGSEVVL